MIRTSANGSHYCDGRECGFPLSRYAGDEDEPALIVCLDCNASMHVADEPKPVEAKP